MANKKTAHPIEAADSVDAEPEFVRIRELEKRTGIKRGICYRKIAEGTFKSILLREPGNKSGVRLVHWSSVKNHLYQLLAEQNKKAKACKS